MADDREAWEATARTCYQRLGMPFPARVGWVLSPLVGAFAAPIAAALVTGHRQRRGLESVYRAVDDAAGGTVGTAVRAAVRWASDGVVGDPVHGAASTALRAELSSVLSSVDADWGTPDEVMTGIDAATDAAVTAAVEAAVGGPRQDALRAAIRGLWRARLPIPGSGGWWWPFRDFVLFSPRPVELHLERTGEQAWNRDRPHRADGPAVCWSDGFGLYFWHGVQVSRREIERHARRC